MGPFTAPRLPPGAAVSILQLMTTVTTTPDVATRDRASAVRTVEGVFQSTGFHWVGNGFFVSTYFPSRKLPAERVSPFVLMDYGPAKEFAPLARGKRGVGWHPHRGFETVTLAWEGAVAHRDNAGHAGHHRPRRRAVDDRGRRASSTRSTTRRPSPGAAARCT